MTTHLPTLATLTAYALALIIEGMILTGRKHIKRLWWWLAGTSAWLLHGELLHQWIDLSSGQNLSYAHVISLIVWVMAGLVLLGSLRKPIASLSIFIFPATMVSILLVWYFPGQRLEQTAAHPHKFIHIWLAVIAFSVLLTAVLQALLLNIVDKKLREKKPSLLTQILPSLETLESLLFQMIALGVILLSVVLITSVYFFHNIFTPALIKQSILTLLAWGVFAILLWGRVKYGWRGRILVRWTLIGGVLLCLAYFGQALFK